MSEAISKLVALQQEQLPNWPGARLLIEQMVGNHIRAVKRKKKGSTVQLGVTLDETLTHCCQHWDTATCLFTPANCEYSTCDAVNLAAKALSKLNAIHFLPLVTQLTVPSKTAKIAPVLDLLGSIQTKRSAKLAVIEVKCGKTSIAMGQVAEAKYMASPLDSIKDTWRNRALLQLAIQVYCIRDHLQDWKVPIEAGVLCVDREEDEAYLIHLDKSFMGKVHKWLSS